MVLSNKAKKRRKQTRRERSVARIYKCKVCSNRLTSNDTHHTMCNRCWKDVHIRQVIINRKKAGKW